MNLFHNLLDLINKRIKTINTKGKEKENQIFAILKLMSNSISLFKKMDMNLSTNILELID